MGVRFLFEIQIMTQLQHAWDKKDHHLIYEHVRAGRGDRIPVHLKNRVTAMSELLYVADTIFDELLEEITQIMKEGPHD
jgi:ppGpp synthetase/RelA/SpoT-type nucleotidyltranferase